MQKAHQILPLAVIGLLLVVAGLSYVGVDKLSNSIIDHGERLGHIEQANDISSYVKRAEGHLLMYLLIRDENDRIKYYSRMDTLEELLWTMTNVDTNIKAQLLNYNEMLSLGTRLAELKHYEKMEEYNSLQNYQYDIRRFHELSSSIHQAGVAYVRQQAELPQKQLESTIWDIIRVYLILGLLGLSCIVAVVFLTRKSAAELELSREIRNQLDKLSNTDGLTGVANRRAFEELLDREWLRAKREKNAFALLLIDIDNFKAYNDNYGHVSGDECLIKVARALEESIRRPADNVFRYGGEEFAILLPATSNILSFAENCRKKIQELSITHMYSGVSNVVTISIGFGVFNPELDHEKKILLERIDTALYKAKKLGKNRISAASNRFEEGSKLHLVKKDDR